MYNCTYYKQYILCIYNRQGQMFLILLDGNISFDLNLVFSLPKICLVLITLMRMILDCLHFLFYFVIAFHSFVFSTSIHMYNIHNLNITYALQFLLNICCNHCIIKIHGVAECLLFLCESFSISCVAEHFFPKKLV